MGGRLSRGADVVVRAASVSNPNLAKVEASSMGRLRENENIRRGLPAPLKGSISSEYTKQHDNGNKSREDQWDTLLTQISGAITSRAWGDAAGSGSFGKGDQPHVAMRCQSLIAKLPKSAGYGSTANAIEDDGQSRNFDDQSGKTDIMGRLSQPQVLELFRHCRSGVQTGNIDAIAKRLNLQERDVRDLLQYNRTYLAENQQGFSKAIYDPLRRIERFEDLQNVGNV